MIRHRFGGHLRAAPERIPSPIELHPSIAILEGTQQGLEGRSGVWTGHAPEVAKGN